MTDPAQFWASFTLDPRRPDNAPLRAADGDRNLVHQALADAYADGRLDREEFEDRSAEAGRAKTLAELAELVEGLIPRSPVPAARSAGLMSEQEIAARAVEAWRRDRREALLGLVSVSAVVWMIWAVTSGPGSFPWPAFVSLAAFLNLVQVQLRRADIVASERRKLEKKRAREIERQRKRGELG